MERRTTADESIGAWLEALASTGPNPGGGAAAALMAGVAAALAEMVVAYRKTPDAPEVERRERAMAAFAGAVREAAPEVADRDTEVASGFAEAESRSEPEERAAAKREASIAAAGSSAALGRFAATLVPVLKELAEDTGRLMLADVGVAAAALSAATRAAALNVCADLARAGEAGRGDLRAAVDELDAATRELDAVTERVRTRLAPHDSDGTS